MSESFLGDGSTTEFVLGEAAFRGTQQARSLIADSFAGAAVNAAAITLTEDLDYAGLELAQGSHSRRKQGLKSRLRALHDAGVPVPRFEGLRLDAADALLDDTARHAHYEGMRERLRRGDHLVPPPAHDVPTANAVGTTPDHP